MRVGLSITVHNSSINQTGHQDMFACIDSFIDNIEYDYKIFIIDNQSDKNIKNSFSNENIDYTYIDNQILSGGLTGAWNLGVSKCYEDNCDVIINSNEDVLFKQSINSFVETIYNFDDKENALFGPITNVGGTSTYHQQRQTEEERDSIIEVTNRFSSHGGQGYALNGFFLGFNKEFYKKFNVLGNIFSTKEKDMWGGQEVELFDRNTPLGMRSFILENCFIKHKKNISWKRRRDL